MIQKDEHGNEIIRTKHTDVAINPGCFSCDGANEVHAAHNMIQYMKDSPMEGIKARRSPKDDYHRTDADGRFAWIVYHPDYPDCEVEVQMPGWPLERVRYMQAEDQNIWDFPRLYVGGCSWVWCYGLIDKYYFIDEEEGEITA